MTHFEIRPILSNGHVGIDNHYIGHLSLNHSVLGHDLC